MTEVTVAFPKSFKLAKIDIGLPTILLLPITTTCFPVKSILKCFKMNIIPLGVHGINLGLPITVILHFLDENHQHPL